MKTSNRERPILFNGAMVRAILAGQKTQTRRVLKMLHGYWETSPNGLVPIPAGCPFGQPGDRLWVRETWSADECAPGEAYYRADATTSGGLTNQEVAGMRWRPSIHMPRWACRLMLEITDVRVERLQSISEGDALSEGVRISRRAVSPRLAIPCFWDYLRGEPGYTCGRDSYASLWDKIAGIGSWDSNPWVWVIEFKVVTP